MRIPDRVVDGSGEEIRIDRAWPRGEGRSIIEGRGLKSGQIRAGRIDADGHASLVPFREDPALPELASGRDVGDLLVHRLKRRAVVRSAGRYRKFLAGGKARAVADAHVATATVLAGSGLEVPDVVDSTAHSVTLSAVPGVSLHDLGRNAALEEMTLQWIGASAGSPQWSRWARAWELWEQSWPRFAGVSASEVPLVDIGAHTAEDEVGTVERWIEFATCHDALGMPEERLRSVSASVARALLAGTSPARLAHRDLHDKQILVDPDTGTVGIIDCDTLALAEPALDLANLAAHLDFRTAQGLLPARAAALGKRHIRSAAETLRVPDSRFEAYASATALRLACIYAFRPPYRDMARTWFSEVEASVLSPR